MLAYADAIEQVGKGNLVQAREALDIAKKAYAAAGVRLMDEAMRELEAGKGLITKPLRQ
jgi:hypothetical protein